jgi:phosphoribosylanthranilate isomerase
MSGDRPVRAKICGLTSLADAEHAAEAGAWAVSMVLWEGSARACDPGEAARIGAALRRRAEVCGVFVNAPLGQVTDLADAIGLSLVQLHGDEGPSYCGEVARRTGARVIKAHRVRDRADVVGLEPFHTDFHLLDGQGGTPFDWELVSSRRSRTPLVLAGGLTPDNVAEAIAAVGPYAVDAASGTEAEPGRKDPALVEAFLAAVREAPVPA